MKIVPPLVVENLLPVAMSFWLEDRAHKKTSFPIIQSGQTMELFSPILSQKDPSAGMALPDLGYETKAPFHVSSNTISLIGQQSERPLVLRIRQDKPKESKLMKMSIFSEFVFVDRTGQDLIFRHVSGKKSDSQEPKFKTHEVGQVPLTLFSLPKPNMHGEKVSIRSKETPWSLVSAELESSLLSSLVL